MCLRDTPLSVYTFECVFSCAFLPFSLCTIEISVAVHIFQRKKKIAIFMRELRWDKCVYMKKEVSYAVSTLHSMWLIKKTFVNRESFRQVRKILQLWNVVFAHTKIIASTHSFFIRVSREREIFHVQIEVEASARREGRKINKHKFQLTRLGAPTSESADEWKKAGNS